MAAAAAKEQAEDEVQRKLAEVEAAMSEALKVQDGAPQHKRRSSSLIIGGDAGPQVHRKGSVEFQKTRNLSYESSSTAEPYASLRRVMVSEYRGCVSALLLCNEEISAWERSYCEQQRLQRNVRTSAAVLLFLRPSFCQRARIQRHRHLTRPRPCPLSRPFANRSRKLNTSAC